ncbi:FluC/FEX family fluoride channel [Aspergillus brunneoviolaceus CBS 621.78]|uniref:Uncharacterized protein n=1 Tax=Aspergillus brunneoviolaceus CBS 621.78 TaxID=1450534 RepID=A0ACD1FW43_9EURO|nr:hypothetical protein BO95DRAFT_518132 [Aspergillus brunneoviolaceus CBS 621.78]RAH41197.1 hypothetical protein BO95DRAFT_518132 [Aspergillus brunneoviolaceus CBS 621.78]
MQSQYNVQVQHEKHERPSTSSLREKPMTESDSGSEINLDEVAAPPPVYDRPDEDHLENQLSHQAGRGEEDVERESQQDPNGYATTVGREEAEKQQGRGLRSTSMRMRYVIAYLVFFSFLGTLLRMVIESLTFYPGAPVNTSVLWANVGGCFIMGFLSEDQGLFRFKEVDIQVEHEDDGQRRARLTAHKKTIPLYIGLTTGFCGSLTSFSTFIRDLFLALSNGLSVPVGPYSDVSLFAAAQDVPKAPNGGFSFMAIIAVLLLEVGLSTFSIKLGAHTAVFVSSWTPRLPQWWLERIVNPCMIPLATLSWIALICLVALLPRYALDPTLWSAEIWRGPVVFALVFSPVGCLARFFLSLKLNSRVAAFPLGTFAANITGTAVLGMAYCLQHSSISAATLGGGSVTGCQVLQGIMDGFCGCLTTVSTWALELIDLRPQHAYVYGVISVVVAFCLLVVEIGSLKWTRGLETPICFSASTA